MILIRIEFIVLVILSLVFFFELNNFNEWVFLYYLIFSVCDGVLGISIMIRIIFYINNQNVRMINLL